MPRAHKTSRTSKQKSYDVPSAQKRKDGGGVPKIQIYKPAGRQAMSFGKSKILPEETKAGAPSMSTMLAASAQVPEEMPASAGLTQMTDACLTTRDSSAKAFMRELRKVVERSDVIIQVLDARDPEGTRSRWVEDEVRKREGQGKKLLGVVNKIDLVPRANLEAWLKYLRHSFPCMPFKSSTQSQRQNLSQNAVPLAQPTAIPGQHVSHRSLPVTSSSLGAPALLHLLKQYALSTPHSSLTVGVVGYPNVGKSSLINSLKRSRACGVAAMPGKTRVIQEVVLDKGVKILDCPGVVLEDVARDLDSEEGRRMAAAIMLRNCVKAELVEDPVSPVEVILSKVDPSLLQKLYNVPPFDDVRDFLIKIALIRGRLGKGGIPDLEGSAVSVLRDWNGGKIPYFTIPPSHHPSSAPVPQAAEQSGDIQMESEQVGSAKILESLSQAFSLEGLLDNCDDEAAWTALPRPDAFDTVHEQAIQEPSFTEDTSATAPPPILRAAPYDPNSSSDADSECEDRFGSTSKSSTTILPIPTYLMVSPNPRNAATDTQRLFTNEEMAVLPSGLLDKHKQKQRAKKLKKRMIAAGRTEDELMLDFLGMDVDERAPLAEHTREPPKKEKRKDKRGVKTVGVDRPTEQQMDEFARKEADFASFLANVGAAESDDEL